MVLVAFEFGFRGGTLGERAGSALAQAISRAVADRRPIVSLIVSGGIRVQEGMTALVQMQRIAGAIAEARRAGIPHLAVVGDPTAGGTWASLAAAADVTLAVPGAEIAFAGNRLRGDGIDGVAFTSEGQYTAGAIDAVVVPETLADEVAGWVAMLDDALHRPASRCAPPAALGAPPRSARAWDSVRAARSAERPHAGAYLDALFTERLEISGDRAGGRDGGVLCGLARDADGRVAAFAAQTGAATRPAGYRTVTRLLRLADRLGVPVLTLIDTPGAACDAEAEADGVGPAIAEALLTIPALRVPITSVLIGEGGSGGALALAAPNALWAAPDSYFCVTAPESVAELLARDRSRAPELSDHLALRPDDLVALGLARGVLSPARDEIWTPGTR